MILDIDKINYLFIGKQGENKATTFQIDATSWLNEFPNGSIAILLKRKGDQVPYPCVISISDKIITWEITNVDTYVAGLGQAEIRLQQDDVIKKSKTIRVEVISSISFSGESVPPQPLEDWYDRMLEVEYNTHAYEQLAKSYAEDIEDLTVSAHSLPTGSTPTVTKTKEDGEPYNLDFGIPESNIESIDADIVIENNNRKFVTASEKQQIGTNADDISDIQDVIPNEASISNKLADKQWVTDNSGKIDVIKLNSVVLEIVNKAVNIILSKNDVGLGNVDNTSDLDKPISTLVQAVLDSINAKIPNQASPSNQLADKDFVNSSIQNVAAYYITKNAQGDPFATKSELTNATVFYSGGQVRVPTRNDYCVVLEDESKTISATGENPTTRYLYENNTWSYQYIVNRSGLTAAQWSAVNSGITALILSTIQTDLSNKVDKVSGKGLSTNDYDNTEKQKVTNATNHISNTSNPHGVTKSQVGLGNVDNTSDSDKPISTATLNALNLKADDNNVVHKTGTDVTDESLYLFRTTGQNKSVVNRVKVPKITGGSVAFNQLVNTILLDWASSYGTKNVTDNLIEYTISTVRDNSYENRLTYNLFTANTSHKYLVTMNAKATRAGMQLYATRVASAEGVSITCTNANTWYNAASIVTFSGTEKLWIRINNANTLPCEIGDKFSIRNLMIIDLTQMFGSTIADALYNAGDSGIALFKSLFPNDYYPYNAGELMSVDINSKKVVGVNQWDEEWELGTISTTTGANESSSSRIRSKNYIRVVPNTTYHLVCNSDGRVCCYDSNKNFVAYLDQAFNTNTINVPSNAHYIRISPSSSYGTTYNHDIQIAIEWSGGDIPHTYHPYETYTYNMNGGVLRGIPKIANGKIYYDGDEYTSNSKIKRKYVSYTFTGNETIIAWVDNTSSTYANHYGGAISLVGTPFENIYKLTASGGQGISSKGYQIKFANENNTIYNTNNNTLNIIDDSCTTQAAWLAKITGMTLVLELATPTEENAPAYQETQYVNDWGTEEFITNNNSIIPIQAYAIYLSNLYDKLNNLPENGINNSYNVVYQNGSKQELVDVKTLKYVHVYGLSYDGISYEIWHMSKSPTSFSSALELYNDMTRKDGIFLNRKITSTASKSAGLYVLPRNSGKVNFWYYKNGVLEVIADVIPTSFSAINVYSFIDFNADI